MAREGSSIVGTLGSLGLDTPHASQLELTAPWGVTLPSTDQPGLYIVREGSVWIRTRPEMSPTEIVAGSVVLLPLGSAHALASDAEARTPPLADFVAEHGGGRGVDMMGIGGGGRQVRLDTFCFHLGVANARRLLASMPELVVLPRTATQAWTIHVARALSELCAHGRDELDASLGLTEALFGVALGEALVRRPREPTRGDESIRLAVALVHADLAHPWTVATLARKVGRSKSAFYDHFAKWTGRSPLEYVAHVRMSHARELLRTSDASIQEVAEAVGYQTASAFAVAFRRWCGTTPSRARASATSKRVDER